MKTGWDFQAGTGHLTLALGLMVASGALMASTVGEARAQDVPVRHRTVHARSVRSAAMRPLTVHRRYPRFARGPAAEREEYAPRLFRRWNDPNLDSFGGWRVGGDNFYGDEAGDTITRGNAALGMISGYGPARGGYGGPHFDSVGGFHNGPGPDAQEDADYASGSISRPDYDGIVPRYPSVKARVAALNTGVSATVGEASFTRASARAGWSSPSRAAATPVPEAPFEGDGGPQYLRTDAIFPDLNLDDF